MTAALPLIAVFAVALCLLSVARPMVAVCGFLILTLTNAPGVFVNDHGLPSIGTLLVPALFGLLLVRTALGDSRPTMAMAFIIPVAVYFSLVAARVPWSGNSALAFDIVNELGKNLIIFLVLIGLLTTPERFLVAVRTATLTIGGLAALSFLQYVTGRFDSSFFGFAKATNLHISGDLHGWRLSGPLPDPNFFAQLLVLALPTSIGLAFTERTWMFRILAGITTLMILAVVLLTYSRGALLALFLLAFAYLILLPRKAILIPVVLSFGIFAMFIAPEDIFDRVYSGIETAQYLLGQGEIGGDPAVSQRISVMRAALLMFFDHPLFGIGPGQFQVEYQSYAIAYDLDPAAPAAAHSLYLQLVAEQGLTGLVLYVILMGTFFMLGIRLFRRLSQQQNRRDAILLQATALAIFGYLAAAIFLHDAFPRFFWTFLALLAASWGAYATHDQKSASQLRSSIMPNKTLFALIGITVLKRHFIAIIIGSVAFGSIATIQAVSTPIQYSAEATLLYRFGREYYPITPTEVRRNWGENINISLDNALATEMHLLASQHIAAATLALVNDTTTPKAAAVDEEALGRIRDFRENFKVRRVQGATLLNVAITNTSPTQANALLDAFLTAYKTRRNELFHSDAQGYFERQQAALSDEEASLRAELAKHKSKVASIEAGNSISEWPPEETELLPKLRNSEKVNEELAVLDTAISDIEARLKTVGARLFDLDVERNDWERSRDYTDEVAPNVEIADRPLVSKVATGSGVVAKALSAAIAGAIFVWLAFIVGAIVMAKKAASNPPSASKRRTRV